MNKAYKFRIVPNSEQQCLLAKTFGCVRFVYNRMLADRIAHYEDTGKSLNITPARYKPEFPWLREVDSMALCNAQMNLNIAFTNFFRGLRQGAKVGFPRFKSKHGDNSYTTNLINGNIQLSNGYLKLPKLGLIRIKQHRQVPDGYRLKSVTISKTASGKYYASILYEYEAEIISVEPKTVIGLDYAMNGLYVDSENNRPDFPRFFRQSEEKLAREQRRLSHMKRGSQNYQKQKRKIAILHEHIANQRKDFLHKQSRQIANVYDAVCVEDLNMRGMAQALNFGKSVSDNGWGMFREMLTYKLAELGKYYVKIDKWFPSSKTCHQCGTVKETLSLATRVYSCEECGLEMDRDWNAAINIREAGRRLLLT